MDRRSETHRYLRAGPGVAREFAGAPRSWRARLDGFGTPSAEGAGARTEDRVLAASVLSLAAFGLVMIFSASAVYAERAFGSGAHFLSRQATYVALGTGAMIAVSHVPYRLLRTLAYPILVAALLGLVAVVGGAGTTVRGAARWIDVGPIRFEPSEVAKLAVVVWLSYSVAKKRELVRTFTIGFVPHALMGAMMGLLCLLQPDFGSAVIIALMTFAILFVAGTRLSYILLTLMVALPIAYQILVSSPYRYQRLVSFLDPWRYRFAEGYQVTESMISFGAGGVGGEGLGQGLQKLFFLPDAHNDFISAIVGEELGLLGVLALLAVFGVVLVRGYRIAVRCRDPFGSFVAFGITTLIGLQVLINLGVAMGVLPAKGLTLPFVSYGGSSLLVQMAAVGVLLNISRGQERTVRRSEPDAAGTPATGRDPGGRAAAEPAADAGPPDMKG